MSDVVVIGAGAIGVTVACDLAQRGMSVQVLDSGRAGAGTTATTFAMDITARKTPRHYFDLALRSAALHEELNERCGELEWRFPAPSIEWGTNEHDSNVMLARRDRLAEWGYESEVADIADLRHLDPGLRLPAAAGGTAVIYPQASWYDPAAYVSGMLARARRAGAVLHEGVEVTSLHYRRGALAGVRSGDRIWEADHVINCAGPAAGRIAEMAGADLPLDLIPGVIGHLDPVPGLDLRSIWTLWTINLRPTRNGGVCLHSYPLDAELPRGSGADTRVPRDLLDRLWTQARPLLPERAAEVPLTAAVGVRPVPADGLPIVGIVPDEPRLYHVVTHSGIHLAPALAELVAADVTSEGKNPALEPYRADRVVGAHAEALDDSMREMTRTYGSGV
ncbi:FAD-dependent oxidoreductase [Saccharopolyspora sp. WRP15-2]|uniref:FAD-dependent oxidoreductase n=1 Tax=Saccharopolyspora oryzae TaxID=2997343 RepID=A0ABT4UQH2_9PSEU|nr:FAD-dependent oxidoreductase [Saccharopolyspora oryzae]MDA3623968.1 FAD-dependent oxidoreductase [Saccharopolyspora oryzae]